MAAGVSFARELVSILRDLTSLYPAIIPPTR